MKRKLLTLLLFGLTVSLPWHALAADDDDQNPHLMVLKDGTPDTDKCGFCHNDDMTLARSKEETCTSCHTIAQQHAVVHHQPGAGRFGAEIAGIQGGVEVEAVVSDDEGVLKAQVTQLVHGLLDAL